ncbi:hypothetical protein [Peptoniphilus timonensis]|uniref:hypothetical protein n=1 Tax=Peptoniphilus timonensis TaxID=1268254 RepID=UPI00031B1579|nr:hypothetical protein [Peptoniphilus timonensis]
MQRETQVKEAIKRMNLLNIFKPTIKEFEDEGKISKSIMGGLYWLDDEDIKRVKEFEEKFNAVVYNVIECDTEFGRLQNLLYVSENQEEWEYDIQDIKDGMVFSYVYNLDVPDFSEFGSIGIRNFDGGLLRVA